MIHSRTSTAMLKMKMQRNAFANYTAILCIATLTLVTTILTASNQPQPQPQQQQQQHQLQSQQQKQQQLLLLATHLVTTTAPTSKQTSDPSPPLKPSTNESRLRSALDDVDDDADRSEQRDPMRQVEQDSNEQKSASWRSAVESLFGQVAKTVVYGGTELIRWNSRLLCSVLTYETETNNTDQPTLFVFNNPQNLERAFKIYADDTDEQLTAELINEAGFDPEQMTLIFVHGWLGGIAEELWLTEAKTAALRSALRQHRHEQHDETRKQVNATTVFRPNVIVVDWSLFARGSLYSATRNSFKVSRRLARLLAILSSVGGLVPERMHCLGHSIGAHICGQAARDAFPPSTPDGGRHRMGRITGLDPGGFCYELDIKNETKFHGLRPSDALLTDAYYSNRSPFGNKYQVAHYNVRLGNGYFQRACSVWRQPEVATKYFRAALQFLWGHSRNNDIIACDHYFATRLAAQLLPVAATCSYVAYACESYRNFVRGQCGLCNSGNGSKSAASQCYTMDFEYQLPSASVEHAMDLIANYSSLDGSGSVGQLPGGVAYDQRRVYYMQVAGEEPYCSMTYRVRVQLSRQVGAEFRADWLKLQLIGGEQEILKVRDASRARLMHTIGLNGPWISMMDQSSDGRTDQVEEKAQFYKENYGVDNETLTALIELAPAHGSSLSLAPSGRFLEPPIRDVIVVYDNAEYVRRQRGAANKVAPNPVEYIKLDYLSSADERIRSKNSLLFTQKQFTLQYKQSVANSESASTADNQLQQHHHHHHHQSDDV